VERGKEGKGEEIKAKEGGERRERGMVGEREARERNDRKTWPDGCAW
jgi:hypothetical protein